MELSTWVPHYTGIRDAALAHRGGRNNSWALLLSGQRLPRRDAPPSGARWTMLTRSSRSRTLRYPVRREAPSPADLQASPKSNVSRFPSKVIIQCSKESTEQIT